ncbi:MAG TPA: hypothetical protein VK470_14800, partial [Bacteroidota bacterium]|nr:hypothetical protein [Bacteroidota bacterium]
MKCLRRLAYITAAVVVSIAVWTLPLFAQKQVQALPTDTLARYGPHVITAADFLERFELMPYPLKDNRARIELTKQEFLQSLVAEKMLALEAQRLGFGQDTVSQEMQYSLQRLFTRDEVYKRDVTAHIRVTPEEMREGMGRYPWELRLIVYRRVSTKEGDILLKKQAISKNKEKTFETSRDMVFAPLDTMTVDFGELEPAAETIAFGLKIGECSSPFLWGRNDWRMVKLVDKYANPTYAKQSVPDQIAEVKKIVSRRQEDSLAARVFISFLGPQRAEADPALVRELADSLLHIIKSDSTNHVKKSFF